MLFRVLPALIRPLAACSLVLLFAAARKPAPSRLEKTLDGIVSRQPGLAEAFLGADIVRLSDGKVLYARNQNHLFVPASNTKLFSLALALERLGPDYRFTTSVFSDAPIGASGRLDGNLVLAGSGDPTLSGRAYPYIRDPQDLRDPQQLRGLQDNTPPNPLQAIENLADQLAADGLKAVSGDIYGDDTRYLWDPYPDGWATGDILRSYGAPVSALAINDNMFTLEIDPGESEGSLAALSLSPAFEFITLDNRVLTSPVGSPSAIHLGGQPGQGELQVWGAIPLGGQPVVESLAISDPALFAAAALRDALIRRGIAVRGRPMARHSFHGGSPQPPAAGAELAKRVSPPLIQILQVTAKVSQNLHAEMLLREVGAVRRNSGTSEAGLAELREFLNEAGIPPDGYRFTDGSGLSRNTLATPEAITTLLRYMDSSPLGEQWQSLLPIGGWDGTLEDRFPDHPEAAAIHAKTGSLGHVRALSGYADSRRYGRLAFSFIVDNYLAPDSEILKFLDTIGLQLLR